MANLASYLDGGGNLFCASNEFAIFRVRLDLVNQNLTTYKYDFQSSDPLAGTGSPSVAGIGMNIPDTVWETEIVGQTLWAAFRVTEPPAAADLMLHNVADAGWILEGTGLGAGDVLPAAFSLFGTGTLIEFDDGGSPVVLPSGSRACRPARLSGPRRRPRTRRSGGTRTAAPRISGPPSPAGPRPPFSSVHRGHAL